MGRGLILETTFLIDLEREALRDRPGPAHAFLTEHASAKLHITLITAGELAAGPAVSGRSRWESILSRFDVVAPDVEAAWRFGQLFRYLRDQGRLIGTDDLWIAAIALGTQLPLVTRNGEHFRRVPGLEVKEY